jgi:hypothetical protein
MSNRKSIVRDCYLRIGDRVVLAPDPAAHNWHSGVPVGAHGTVIGFHRYETHVPRIGGFGKKPGVYMCNGGGVVAWDTGHHTRPGADDLVWLADHDKLSVERSRDKAWNDAFEINQLVGDLPNLPYWEHDIVRDKTGRVTFDCHKGLLKIARIHYSYLWEKRTDGSAMPLYSVEALFGNSGYTWTDNENLELVERGNVWKWFNARDTIVWADLREEADFHRLLGAIDEVRNPRSGISGWNVGEILPALQAGLIDVPSVSPGLFGAGASTHCYKFHDRDLGERVRAQTLKGFTTRKDGE